MIGAYKSDYVRVSGYNVKKFRYGWGGEDIDLINRFVRHGYTVIRPREHGLLHRWHKKLSWRKESQCDFHWRKGTFCATAHDKHSDTVEHKHTWNFKLSFSRNCDYDQDSDLLGQHAASIDIPPGNYELTLLSKLPNLNNEEIESEDNVTSAKPRVHLKATDADLADGIKDDHDEKLFNLKNVIQSDLSGSRDRIQFNTTKDVRVYLWVSPCRLDAKDEERDNEIAKVVLKTLQ